MLEIKKKEVYHIDYKDWDEFVKKEFPNCPYDSIVSEEEMNNDSVWAAKINGRFESEKDRKRVEDFLKDVDADSLFFGTTESILNYLVSKGDLLAGNYNIEICW